MDVEDDNVEEAQLVTQQYEQGVQPIQQQTEMGEMMKHMFPNRNDNSTKMLGNLHPNQAPYAVAFLGLAVCKVAPKLARDLVLEQILVSVSIGARGRDDGVNMIGGKKEQERLAGFGGMKEGMKNFMGMGGK